MSADDYLFLVCTPCLEAGGMPEHEFAFELVGYDLAYDRFWVRERYRATLIDGMEAWLTAHAHEHINFRSTVPDGIFSMDTETGLRRRIADRNRRKRRERDAAKKTTH